MKTAQQNGAVAGKLTGGVGGSMLILAEDLNTAKRVSAAEKAGAEHTWIEYLGG